MLVWVTEARHVGGYRLWLRFNDGAMGEVDLGSRLYGEMFEPLRDPELFRQVRVDPELDTVVWPNGADFAPEFLHDLVVRGASEVAEP
jgi:hypothetical protein